VSWWTPELFDLEDHGYGRGTGHAIGPGHSLIAAHQGDGLWSVTALRTVYTAHTGRTVPPLPWSDEIRNVYSSYLCGVDDAEV
jgi:hypothetical protein